MPDKVEFEVNIPQEVSFPFADRRAETSDSGDYVRYSPADNPFLFAEPVLAEKIAALCVGAGVILVMKAEARIGTPRPLEGLAQRAEEPTFAGPPAPLGPSAAHDVAQTQQASTSSGKALNDLLASRLVDAMTVAMHAVTTGKANTAARCGSLRRTSANKTEEMMNAQERTLSDPLRAMVAQAQQQHDAAEHPGPQSQAAKSIVQSAQRLARSAARSMGPALPWLHGAREVREAIEGILAAHFERQLEDELALCAHCGSARVNYTERDGRTGVTLDGYCETATEAGYSCGDCGAFEEGVIEIDLEVGA